MRKLLDVILDLASVALFAAIIHGKAFAVKYALVGDGLVYAGFRNGTMGAALIIATLLLLLRPWQRWKAFWCIDLLITLALLVDIVYSRYFHDMPSVALLKQAKLVGDVKSSVTALLRPRDLLYFLDLLLFLPAFWGKRARQLWSSATVNLVARVAIASCLLMVGVSYSRLSLDQLRREQPGLLQTFCDKKYIAVSVGMLNYHAVDIANYLQSQLGRTAISASDQADVVSYFSQAVKPAGDYYGSMQGKNLIMLQLESFQQFVVDLRMNGQEITPNLNRLTRSSLYFDHTYYQTAWGGTSDAEFLSNVSMLPAREGSAYYEFSGNTYAALPSVLRELGYYTVTMHPNKPDFYNRVSMYQALGFEEYASMDDFNIDETFGLGLTDHSFYRQAVAKLQTYQQPFYAFLISLTSHFPFKDEAHPLQDDLDLGQFEGTLLGDYLHAVHYADQAIGLLVAELQATGLWDSSVVVMYGDHAAINYDNRQLLAELAGKNELSDLDWLQAQRVPLLVHLPGEALEGRRQLVAGQIDIYPTVANLLGFRGPYALGQDLLNAEQGFVCFRNGTWIDDQLAYLGSGGSLLELTSGRETLVAGSDQLTRAEQTLRVSDLVLEHDLLSSLLSKGQTGY